MVISTKHILLSLVVVAVTSVSAVSGETGKLWSEFATSRKALPGFHQEFELTRTVKFRGVDQASRDRIMIDVSQEK